MPDYSRPGGPEPHAALQLRVVGPDGAPPSRGEFRRLFEARRLSRERRLRLQSAARLLAVDRGRVVGVAVYEPASDGLRVYEIAVDREAGPRRDRVVHRLLDGLELACLAGGCRRLLLMPAAAVAIGSLEQEGYRFVGEPCHDCWLERRVG